MRTSDFPVDISCTARRGSTLSGPFCIQGQTCSDYMLRMDMASGHRGLSFTSGETGCC